MTTHLQKQQTPFAPYEDIDLTELAAANGRLSLSYSHASQLTFTVIAPEHSIPIERLAFVRLWIEGATLDDGETIQDADHPLFEGFVESVGPGGDSLRVSLMCADPTFRTARELTLMSAPWTPGTPDPDPELQIPPTEGIGAIPRVIYNAIDEADPDYAYGAGNSGTIGQIIAGILDLCREPLWWRNCSPGTIETGALAPYVDADLTPLDFAPQEKIVWESESPRASTERLQRYEPRARLLWHPGTRLWRFSDITQSPQVTIRLNDPTIDFPVLSLDLTPSIDKAYTALRIYGPPTATTEEFTWISPEVAAEDWVNTLVPIGDPVELEIVGLETIQTYTAWQIVNTAKRRGARLLPDWYDLRVSEYIWENTKYPQFLLSWNAGNTWVAASNCFLDWLNGKAVFPATVPYCISENQYGQSLQANGQHYFPPNAARLLWAPIGDSLSVRVPETGYQGTAFTVAGLQLERRLLDEQLAIGYEYGIPVTSAERIAQMTKLAQSQLEKSCDITWVGGCVLDGLDFQWCRLNRRVSFEASNGSGGTVTTGWEAINAYVTDVEYDFAERTTTLQFSSDRAEAIGDDPSQIKQRLAIRALEQRQYEQITNLFRTYVNWKGGTYQELAGVQINSGFEYVDSTTGKVVYTD